MSPLRPHGIKSRTLRMLLERGRMPVRDVYAISNGKWSAFSRLYELRRDGLIRDVPCIELTDEGHELAQAMHDEAMNGNKDGD